MKQFILSAILAVASVFAVNAQSNQSAEYEALMDQALATQNTEQVMIETLVKSFQQFVDNGTLTQERCTAMATEMTKAIMPDAIATIKKVWSDNLTLDELKQVVAWTTSPTGQKLIGLQSVAAAQMQEIMTTSGAQQKMIEIVTKYMQ